MSETEQRPVLVVDFGAQYAQLIARRVREANVYSEIVPHSITADEVKAKDPAAIVLSGGPSSVYEQGAPALDADILDLGVPVLGICYGFQAMATALGGEVAQTGQREYGATDVTVTGTDSVLLGAQPASQVTWMSHGDSVAKAPEGFEVLASSASTPVAAFASDERKLYGVQWHPEVKHSVHGQPCSRTSCTVPPACPVTGTRRTSSTSRSPASGRRWATPGSSPVSPVGSTPPWPPPSCTRPSATS